MREEVPSWESITAIDDTISLHQRELDGSSIVPEKSHGDAIPYLLHLIKTVNGLTVSILVLAVTGFSIFQALANGETLITLLKINEKELSEFQEYNYFFFAFSLFSLLIIMFNFLCDLVLGSG